MAARRRELGRHAFYRRSAAVTADTAELARRAIARLRNLPPPRARSRRAALDDYLESASEVPRVLAAQAAAQRSGDTREVMKLNKELAGVATRSRAAARRFGFSRCGGA